MTVLMNSHKEMTHALKLEEILHCAKAGADLIQGSPDTEVRGITLDSRCVKQRYIFCAVAGTDKEGSRFIPQALDKGASVLVLDRLNVHEYRGNIPAGVALVGVSSPREYAGLAASAFYGSPSDELSLIGITGTNGKTTISYLLEGILRESGLTPGVIGTVNQRLGELEIPSTLTTPDAVNLQALLSAMLDNGAKAVALEVSSHALDQHRIAGCRFAVSVFTNLSRDHLDYHLTMESYFEAKKKLFLDYPSTSAVINVDDPWGARLRNAVRGNSISYGMGADSAVRPVSCSMGLKGIRADIATPEGTLHLSSPLSGRHNLFNLMAAAAAALSLGIEGDAIESGIRSVMSVPGRLEPVSGHDGVFAFVDYAHTPDALELVLCTLRKMCRGRLFCITGCGGDRDKGKRPLMAGIAARLADRIYFTSDNPRTEDPLSILGDMMSGLKRCPERADRVHVIPDRREAIFAAAGELREGDCLVVAGKGHETYQILGKTRIPFDDRTVLKEALQAREKVKRGTAGKNVHGSRSGFPLKAASVRQATGAVVVSGSPEILVRGISTDSRSIRRGELFWALSGERFDGHNFVPDVLKKGAAGAVVDCSFDPRAVAGALKHESLLLRVPDTLKALGDMARRYRKDLGIIVVGITGSCGKTTTKEMVAGLLEQKWPVAKTQGNFNNLIGLPRSLFSARSDDRFAVLEMGMNRPGEIGRLCEIAQPDIGLVTTIQAAHLEGLGDMRGVADEKGSLFRSLPAEGVAVVNMDDPWVVKKAQDIECRFIGYSMKGAAAAPGRIGPPHVRCISWVPEDNGTRITLELDGSRVAARLSLMGRSNVQNATAAAAVGHALGLTPFEIKTGLEKAIPVARRLTPTCCKSGAILIDDSYNANPASMGSALETLSLWGRSRKKIAILGDMLELGEKTAEYHHAVGRDAAAAGIDLLISVGCHGGTVSSAAKASDTPPDEIRVFPDTDAVLDWLSSEAMRVLTESPAILVKGSRGMKLDAVSDVLSTMLSVDTAR